MSLPRLRPTGDGGFAYVTNNVRVRPQRLGVPVMAPLPGDGDSAWEAEHERLGARNYEEMLNETIQNHCPYVFEPREKDEDCDYSHRTKWWLKWLVRIWSLYHAFAKLTPQFAMSDRHLAHHFCLRLCGVFDT